MKTGNVCVPPLEAGRDRPRGEGSHSGPDGVAQGQLGTFAVLPPRPWGKSIRPSPRPSRNCCGTKTWASRWGRPSPGGTRPTGIPRTGKLLGDKDAEVCIVIVGLADRGPETKTAIPALAESVHDENADVRIAVVSAMRQIGPAAVPVLTILLQDRESRRS